MGKRVYDTTEGLLGNEELTSSGDLQCTGGSNVHAVQDGSCSKRGAGWQEMVVQTSVKAGVVMEQWMVSKSESPGRVA